MPPEGRREGELAHALQRFAVSEQRTINALLDLRLAWRRWEADPSDGNRQEALTAAHEAWKATVTYITLGEEVMAMVGIKTPDWVSNLANSLAEMSRELLETLPVEWRQRSEPPAPES
jgi:hypothetical protein